MKKGYGAPTTGTPGNVGDYYVDLNSDALYKLVKIVPEAKKMQFVTRMDYSEKTQYVWEAMASSNAEAAMIDDIATDEPDPENTDATEAVE